ncbi:MAG TPA: aldose 1-epimerase [Solirubrobacteraceae bacterium]|nr:aldose 1-epimerase [Solirubrobacteraceae bacterium]
MQSAAPQGLEITLGARDGELSATFLPSAGMVCCSIRHRGEEILAQRAGLGDYLARGSTFALPLLYPWANRLSGWDYRVGDIEVHLDRDDPRIHRDQTLDLPMHGVLGACRDWRVVDRGPDVLSAELDYGADARRLAAFPFPHRLALHAALSGSTLTLELTVRVTGARAVPVCFGFHPYLNPGGPREDWEIRGPVPGLDGRLGARSFDEGHRVPAQASFTVTGASRSVALTFEAGYGHVQVFAPTGSDFIALEPMTAPKDALRSGTGLRQIPPGGEFHASFSVAVAGRAR